MKNEDESWFRTTSKDSVSMNRDVMSVRVSNSAQDMSRRNFTLAAGESLSDGDETPGFCCFPRGRTTGRKAESLMDDAGPGAPFARLDVNQPKGSPLRSQSVDRTCCCYGPRWGRNYTVEVRSKDVSSNGPVKEELRTKGRWEVDVNDEYYKPTVWKQFISKVRAHAWQVQSARSEWINYDPQSYEKNFDNGAWRDSYSQRHYDENDELGLKERALHTALLQKFASSRSQQMTDSLPTTPIPSPLPVRTVSKEEIDKSKEDFVPIWQRRAGTPIRLDLRQRSGPPDL